MRDNVEKQRVRKTTLREVYSCTYSLLYAKMKSKQGLGTDLRATTALGLQLVPSIIEHFAPYLSTPPVNRVSGSAPVTYQT